MPEDHGEAVPLNALPDPALAYSVDGEDARITTTNRAFRRQFSEFDADASVSALFDRFSTQSTTGGRAPLAHLVRAEAVGIYLDDRTDAGPFFVRVAPTDDSTGYLVFSDLQYCPEADEPLGVDHVSSVISHDLRNPLDVAKAHLRAARETGDDAHFDSVADAHDRMEQIIRDVLTLTRGSGAVDPSSQVSIESAATAAWESVDADGMTLELATPLPTVSADPDRVQRLFENLFRNSVEHSSVSYATGADTRSSQEDTDAAVEESPGTDAASTITVGSAADGFYVADDGPGISPRHREVVFEPGYSTRNGGTGLGLAIVEQIVDAHGWEIELTAADAGGARFDVSV
jgi:signal transduction histidine kinase